MSMEKAAITRCEAVAFDLDGTIYYGNSLIDGAKELVGFLQSKNIRVFYFSNNSMRTRKDIYEKLSGMGLELNSNEVYNSAYATAVYAKKKGIKKVCCVGSPGLLRELENSGVAVTEDETQAEALIAGLDTHFDYEKLSKALVVITRDVPFIACNLDRNYPVGNGKLLPGCGPIIAAIGYSLNKEPDFIVGKPNTYMLDLLSKEHKVAVHDILVVGDTYDSDIAMANRAGCHSILISEEVGGYNDTVVANNPEDVLNILKRCFCEK